VREEENVVIRAGDCSLTLLPALGGKIASLRLETPGTGTTELLQTPLKSYGPVTRSTPFSDADASGWDECLPSVAACEIETHAGLATIPDHGDIWRVPAQILSSTEDSATLRVNCFSLPLQLTRSLILTEATAGWRLQLLYSLTNVGAYPAPWSWSAHPLFAVDPGDRIVLPEAIHTLRIEGSARQRLGRNGSTIPWPKAGTAQGSDGELSADPAIDLSVAQPIGSGIGDKLFAGPLASAQQGWASLERAQIGLRLTVRFEPSLTPFLGLWLCYGGWPDSTGRKQMCVALEPSTARVDALSQTGDWSRKLEPGDTFTWPMELFVEKTKN
jgi:galactose mutarotase-like enzyme